MYLAHTPNSTKPHRHTHAVVRSHRTNGPEVKAANNTYNRILTLEWQTLYSLLLTYSIFRDPYGLHKLNPKSLVLNLFDAHFVYLTMKRMHAQKQNERWKSHLIGKNWYMWFEQVIVSRNVFAFVGEKMRLLSTFSVGRVCGTSKWIPSHLKFEPH